MLTINPAKRIAAHEALKHPWVCVSRPSLGPPPGASTLARAPRIQWVPWFPGGCVACGFKAGGFKDLSPWETKELHGKRRPSPGREGIE